MEIKSSTNLTICSRYLKVSPQKMRLVTNLVRRKELNNSINILRYLPQKGSKILTKILQGVQKQLLKKSGEVNNNSFFINQIKVDRGVIRKSIMMRAKGSANTVKKVNCHLTLQLIENKKYGAKS